MSAGRHELGKGGRRGGEGEPNIQGNVGERWRKGGHGGSREEETPWQCHTCSLVALQGIGYAKEDFLGLTVVLAVHTPHPFSGLLSNTCILCKYSCLFILCKYIYLEHCRGLWKDCKQVPYLAQYT